MTSIHSVTAVAAEFKYKTSELVEAVRPWLEDSGKSFELFSRLSYASQIESRHFALSLPEIFALNGISQRAEVFNSQGLNLGLKALSGLDKTLPFDTLITSSCSVPSLPGLDCLIAEELKLSPSLQRIPFYQHGCVAGAIGIALASRLAIKNPVAVLSVEICSLVHRLNDLRPEQILGTILFADGAGGALITPDDLGPLRIMDCETFRISGSVEELGYTLEDDGAHLRISKDLPTIVESGLLQCIEGLLSRNKLNREDIKWWLSHPGGAKILDSIQANLNIDSSKQRWSWQTLAEVGNISSAGIFHVIKRFLSEACFANEDMAIILGIGPGVTLEAILVECRA